MLDLSYRSQHWGDDPTGVEVLRWPNDLGCQRLGRLAAISYMTSKDGTPETYRHAFGGEGNPLDPPLPELLDTQYRGRARSPKVGKSLVALGRVLDLEFATGEIIHPIMLWIATVEKTDLNGGPVILASRFDVPFAIEHRFAGKDMYPFITTHGIEG